MGVKEVHLFNVIPLELFRIFIMKNRIIYSEALIAIWNAYKNASLQLSKDDCNAVLFTYFMNKQYKLEEEDEEDIFSEDSGLTGDTRKIMRILVRYGWIEEQIEMGELETYIVIPNYAGKFLEAIQSILEPSDFETGRCVTDIYLNIKEIDKGNSSNFIYFEGALKHSENLNRLIQDMLHGMRQSFNQLLNQTNLSGVFDEHFKYGESQIYNTYNLLKTEENMFKYRQDIMQKCTDILFDNDLQEEIIEQLMRRKQRFAYEDAKEFLIRGIDKIRLIFEDVEIRDQQITNRHQQYLNATVERIRYLQDKKEDLKGYLGEIVETLTMKKCSEKYINAINDNIEVLGFNRITESSFWKPPIKKEKFDPEPNNARKGSLDTKEESRTKIKDKEKNKNYFKYAENQVELFLNEKMLGKDEVNTKDIDIENRDELIKLVMAYRMSSRKNSKYESKKIGTQVEKDNNTFISKYPELIIRRKS
jgi:hypothetical protein